MAKKNSLGRGLDSLFLENDEPDTGSVSMLRVSDIEPNPLQPRKTFDNEALGQLADSISRHGLLQPIAVRTNECGFYRIIAGERRWRAAKMAGLIEIPAIIYDMDDKKAAELALIENLQREDLNPIEEAMGYKRLSDEYGLTQEEISNAVSKSRSGIANSLRLLTLPDDVIEAVREAKLSMGHAKALVTLGELASEVAKKVMKHDLNVRQTEKLVRELQTKPKDEPEKPKTEIQMQIEHLERELETSLGRKVKITHNGKKGKITLDYYDNDDFEGLMSYLLNRTL